MDVRLVKPMTKQCERARECASLRLDGELSEFEHALLVAHLARCEPCRSFAHELESATNHMRSTPLARLDRPVALPSRRRLLARRPVEVAAAAAALMLTTLGVAGALRTIETTNPTISFGAPGVSNTLESREFSDIRRSMLRRPNRQQSPGGLNLPLT
jgi:anti-sigma factor RsiW